MLLLLAAETGEYMVHISFDPVDEFIPRVPLQRCPGEDKTMKRICAAPDILSALQSIPCAGNALYTMKKLGMRMIIHAYYFKDCEVMDQEFVKQSVPDASVTKEIWIVSQPKKIVHRCYEITDILCPIKKDRNNVKMHFAITADWKRVKNQDNWDNFINMFSYNMNGADILNNLRKECSFRTLITNIDDEMMEHLLKIKQ